MSIAASCRGWLVPRHGRDGTLPVCWNHLSSTAAHRNSISASPWSVLGWTLGSAAGVVEASWCPGAGLLLSTLIHGLTGTSGTAASQMSPSSLQIGRIRSRGSTPACHNFPWLVPAPGLPRLPRLISHGSRQDAPRARALQNLELTSRRQRGLCVLPSFRPRDKRGPCVDAVCISRQLPTLEPKCRSLLVGDR
jgi:hypothetical protein